MSEDALPEPDRVDGFPHPRETLRLFGHDGAEHRLLDALTGGRLHHAWLLRGPKGIGKATLAYRAARTLIALPGEEAGLFGAAEPVMPDSLDAPVDCPVRRRIIGQGEPRLMVIRRSPNPDTGRMRTRISVQDVRRLQAFLGLTAADGGWRAVVIDPADEMDPPPANALLKFLEEPPPKTVFLLVCHAPAGLLPTIRSRCRTLDLSPLCPDDLAFALAQAGAEIDRKDSEALAELAAGSVGAALRLIANGGLDLYTRIAGLADRGSIDRAGMIQLAEICGARNAQDSYTTVISLTQTLLSRLAKTAATGTPPPPAAPNEHRLMSAVASQPQQAAAWAETLAKVSASTRHAVAVNLDPAQTILDMFLEIDATLGRVRMAPV